jgi:hypothetical protein
MSGSYSDDMNKAVAQLNYDAARAIAITGSHNGTPIYGDNRGVIVQNHDTGTIAKQVFDMMYGHFAPDVILKCQHCGQWGALGNPCRSCGAPIK